MSTTKLYWITTWGKRPKSSKQDLQHGRPFSDNYLTGACLKAHFGEFCHGRGDCLRIDIQGKVVESNLSADRMGNFGCHLLNNIVPLRVTCNQCRNCG